MKMFTTYKGYFKNGRFISSEPVTIPDDIEVHVTVISDNPIDETTAQRQYEAMKELIEEMDNEDGNGEEITDEDIALLERSRINFRRILE
jgi:acyl dehydratase